jgi:hypothetical protein
MCAKEIARIKLIKYQKKRENKFSLKSAGKYLLHRSWSHTPVSTRFFDFYTGALYNPRKSEKIDRIWYVVVRLDGTNNSASRSVVSRNEDTSNRT